MYFKYLYFLKYFTFIKIFVPYIFHWKLMGGSSNILLSALKKSLYLYMLLNIIIITFYWIILFIYLFIY